MSAREPRRWPSHMVPTLCVAAIIATTSAIAGAQQATQEPATIDADAPAPRFRIVAVPLLHGTLTNSAGVNGSGLVAGNADHDAFVARGGRIHAVAHEPGHRFALATAVNASGIVAGYDEETFRTPAVAFVLADDRRIDLRGLSDGSSYALALNDAGWVAGRSRDEAGADHAALWRDGQVVDLDPLLPTNQLSEARAINAAGDVAGDLAPNGGIDAFESFAVMDGVARVIRPFGSSNSTALAINDSRVVCGHFVAANQRFHGYCWQDGRAIDFGTLTPDGDSYAFALNDADAVVGAATGPRGDSRAILFDRGRLHDLNDLIAPASGWTLQRAIAISPDGRITGQGTFEGAPRSFLLTPGR